MEKGKDNKPLLSIVIPVYNEQQSIFALYEKLLHTLNILKTSYEIIFIDDGSTDNTLQNLKILNKKIGKKVKIISFRTNMGKGEALSAGFQEALGTSVVTLDSDLQDDPAEIPKLLIQLEKGFDVVSGWKYKRQDSLGKTFPSYIFNLLASTVMGFRIHDINCGLKAYKRQVLEEVSIRGDFYRFIPLLAFRLGFTITEIKVKHRKRIHGKSKYGLKRIVDGFLDILTIFFITRYNEKPAHFFGLWGIALISTGFIFDAYVLFLKITTGSTQGRIPMLLLGILLIIVGVQLVSLGLLGELYLTKESKNTKHIKYKT